MTGIVTKLFGKTIATAAVRTVLAGAAFSAIPTTSAMADPHGGINVDVDIRSSHRHYDGPTIYEDRPMQVWVEPVYRTVSERQWIAPVYRTVVDHVWCPPVTKTVTERIWCPDRYEDRRVTHYGPHGPRVTYEHQLIPAHYEDRSHEVVVTPGHYDDVQRQELVSEDHWGIVDRQECVTPGHYETHMERVAIERSHVEQKPVGRIGIRLPF